MTIQKTVYNSKLLPPYSYTVECGGWKAEFKREDKNKIGEWINLVWAEEEDGFFNVYSPAYIYYNIDWDSDHILYAKYERIG